MAQSIVSDPTGDTPKQIEDKVRALPDNQSLNEDVMQERINTEIAEAKSAGTLKLNESHPAA